MAISSGCAVASVTSGRTTKKQKEPKHVHYFELIGGVPLLPNSCGKFLYYIYICTVAHFGVHKYSYTQYAYTAIHKDKYVYSSVLKALYLYSNLKGYLTFIYIALVHFEFSHCP